MHFTTSFRVDIAKAAGVDEAIFYDWVRGQTHVNEAMGDEGRLLNGRWWVLCPREMLVKVFPFWTENQIGRIIENLTEKSLLVQKSEENGMRLFSINEYEPVEKKKVKKEKPPAETTEPDEIEFLKTQLDGTKLPVKMKRGTIVNELINLFKAVNPSYGNFFSRPSERKAMENLVRVYPADMLYALMAILPKTNQMQYAPIVTSPMELEKKAATLIAFARKKQSEGASNSTRIII